MSIGPARLLGDAWAIFRREAELIVAIAGALVFLPAFAVQLLCDPLPPLPAQPNDQAAMDAWITAVSAWGQSNGLWYILADLIGMVGLAAIALLLLSPDRLSVRAALGGTMARLGRFIIANLLTAIPVGLGLWMFVLPGLYFQARFVAVIPVIAAESSQSVARAIGRSWRVTGRAGFGVLGAVLVMFMAQWLLVSPLLSLDSWMRQPGHDNQFLIALITALLAAAATFYNVALLLVGVVAYRRFSSTGT